MKPGAANTILRYLVAFIFAVLTFRFGPIMSLLQTSKDGAIRINVIWDSLYGIGFGLSYLVFGDNALERPWFLFGFIIWPVILFVFLACMAGTLLRCNFRFRLKITFILLFLCTFAFNIRLDRAQTGFYRFLPFYTLYYDSLVY